MRSILAFGLASLALSAQLSAQQNPKDANKPEADKGQIVVLSGTATTAKILDPNSKIVLSGYVMRVADFGALVSANSEAVQHLRTLERHSHDKDRPTPQSAPKD